MKKEKEDNKEFIFRDHFKPVANWVVCEDVKEMARGSVTKSGIIMPLNHGESSTPEADEGPTGDSLGRRVIAKGPDVNRVEIGDLIIETPGSQIAGMNIFGGRYFFLQDYMILAVLSEEADAFHAKITKDQRKEKEELAAAKRALMFKAPEAAPNKLDIN